MRYQHLVRRVIVGIASVLLLLSTRLGAGEPPAAAPAAPQADATAQTVDPKADAVIRKMSDFYKGLKTAECVVDTSMKMEGAGRKEEMQSTAKIAVERPNKAAVRVSGAPMGGGTVVSDGTKLHMHLPMMQKYAEQDAPKTLDELIDSPVVAITQYGNIVLMLFTSDPHKKIMEGVSKVTYVGQEEIDGKKYDRLHYEQDDADLDVWTEASDTPHVRRVKPDFSRQIAKAAEQMPHMQGMKMEGTIEVKDWQIGQPVAAEAFTFAAPADATKVNSMQEIFGGPPRAQEEEHALKGKPAPDFSLDLLGGGKASLAEHKGKNIVILDFWATWCPPCVKGLPIVTEVAKSYADKGVVFYAVNEQEDAATIEPFLKTNKLDIKVALDADGKVGNAYGVTGIPQTVIIDKDGMVKVVHVGLSPNLKSDLSKELDNLLGGEAAPAASKQ